MPADTFVSTPPHWHWLVVLYFFIGGIGGGSFFLAAMLDLLGTPADRAMARIGYYIAFPAVLLSGPILIWDLNRPERFWHMLFQSERFPVPMFKWWSPMSIGSWGLTAFGLFSTLAFLGALAESGRLNWGPLRALRRDPLRLIIAALGGLSGFFLAGYTGVLLSVTNRPFWSDTNLLGLLFLMSGGSTAAALMILLGRRLGEGALASLSWLKQMDSWILILELLVLVALLLSLAPIVDDVLFNGWGLLLLVGVVLLGILVPLLLHYRPGLLGGMSTPAAALLVLIGGFILRTVIVMSVESVPTYTLFH